VPVVVPFVGCPESPRAGCGVASLASLIVSDRADDARDRITWRWMGVRGAAALPFGDPRRTTGYALCVWDSLSGEPSQLATMLVDSGNKWRVGAVRGGFRYQDSTGDPDGVEQVRLAERRPRRVRLRITAKGLNLPRIRASQVSHLAAMQPALTVQLINSEGSCWESTFTSADRNDASRFGAKRN
jgi:hypothetical protein